MFFCFVFMLSFSAYGKVPLSVYSFAAFTIFFTMCICLYFPQDLAESILGSFYIFFWLTIFILELIWLCEKMRQCMCFSEPGVTTWVQSNAWCKGGAKAKMAFWNWVLAFWNWRWLSVFLNWHSVIWNLTCMLQKFHQIFLKIRPKFFCIKSKKIWSK